jgi:hypothetical protein
VKEKSLPYKFVLLALTRAAIASLPPAMRRGVLITPGCPIVLAAFRLERGSWPRSWCQRPEMEGCGFSFCESWPDLLNVARMMVGGSVPEAVLQSLSPGVDEESR